MKLRPVEPETEVDAGQWIRPRLLEWWSLPDHRMPVGATVPTGFEDYVRVFHPPYRTSDEMDRPVRWSELASLAGVSVAADTAWDDLVEPGRELDGRSGLQAPRQGTLLADQTIPVVRVLRRHTATPDACQFALWDGYGGLDYERWPGASRLELPGRSYVVLKGPVEAAG